MIVKRNESNSQHEFNVGDVLRLSDHRDSEPRYCMIVSIQVMDGCERDEVNMYGVALLSNQGHFQGHITANGSGPRNLADDLYDSVDGLMENLYGSWDKVEYAKNFYGVDGEDNEES